MRTGRTRARLLATLVVVAGGCGSPTPSDDAEVGDADAGAADAGVRHDGGGGAGDAGAGRDAGDGGSTARGCAPPPPSGATHPASIYDADELRAVRDRALGGEQPWARAYAVAIAAADQASSVEPQSVRWVGVDRSGVFTAEPPYCGWSREPSPPCGADCCDGYINPNSDREDYFAAIAIGRAVRDLALGWTLTGEPRYADHAVELLHTWAVDPATRMDPVWDGTTQVEISTSITIPGMFYGADLLFDYPGWDRADRDAFVQWARDLAADVRPRSEHRRNNFANWRLVLLGSAAALTEDDALFEYVFAHHRTVLEDSVDPRGHLPEEERRTRGLFYSTYALNAMLQVAEMARHHGVDLYHFEAASGAGSVERALDYLAPYVVDPSTWPYQQIDEYGGANAALFELAYLSFDKPAYLSAIERWGRPLTETRTAGALTFSHARGAFPWALHALTGGVARSDARWRSERYPAASGSLTVELELRPCDAPMNGGTGLARGAASGWADLAVAVRFAPGGQLDVRDGSAYAADVAVPYTAGELYAVRLEVDLTTRTYDVYVREAGGPEVALAAGYGFRTEQATVDQLDHVAVFAGEGSHETTVVSFHE